MANHSSFEKVRQDLDSIPVIDCHEHSEGPTKISNYRDGLDAVIGGYIQSDLRSASSDQDVEIIYDTSKSI
ncbi:MAG: hypothetical protein QGH20_11555 [Candidatus Latescibacteria bacterium]|nr:hypothetical protein [Candidatus Latescibacterota bacterium]